VRRRIRSTLGLVAWAVAAVGLCVVGQEPILSFTLDEETVTISQGGTSSAILRIENESVHAADAIEPSLASDGLTLTAEPAEIEELGPFGTAAIALRLVAADEMPLGTAEQTLELLYTYCIGDYCYQIVEEIPFAVTVEPAPVVPIETPIEVPVELPVAAPAGSSASFWFRLGGMAFAVVLFGVAAGIQRASGRRWPLYAATLLLAVGGLVYGVSQSQHDQAQSIGAVLCTSCVGIEVAQHGEPTLSANEVASIAAVDREIELLVFYAEWCHACPYAERLVELAAEHNPRITYRFVDVEAEPELAEASGVIRSGRTVVPAILRTDTEAILFGAEDLEARLIGLLEGTP